MLDPCINRQRTMALQERLQDGSALFVGNGTWLEGTKAVLLRGPTRVLVASAAEEVWWVLEEVQREQERGQFVAGYLSYEAGAGFGLATHPPSDLAPVGWFAVYPPEHVEALQIGDLGAAPGLQDVAEHATVTLNVTRDDYGAAIGRIKEYIAAGHTYQVNYTCHARFALELDPAGYFLALARSHPVPYAAYLNLGQAQIISLSPELFLERRGDRLASRPMKGTRARGRTLEEDRQAAEDLTNAEKDRAENLMIVDMVRNDLGRVCRIGSIQVPALFTAEKYRSVWQMTSTVTGELLPGTPLAEVFAATFPGASVTGAPKKRTMEIIRELELEPRGPYTGAIGLFAPSGDFTCNLPIRTLVHRAGHFDLGIGAGIVWDSGAESEYEETLLKSRFAFGIFPDLQLWETMLITAEGECRYLEEHLARLARSAEYWQIAVDVAQARAQVLSLVADALSRPCVLRMELSQDGELTFKPREMPGSHPPLVRVLVSEVATNSADRFLYHKTNRRTLYDIERQRALNQGFFEALFRNERGHLTEGAISNLFLQIGGHWVTPPVSDGLLPGVWRADFLRQVGAAEEHVTLDDLAAADEVVVGNSVRGAVEVDEVHVGGRCVYQRRSG